MPIPRPRLPYLVFVILLIVFCLPARYTDWYPDVFVIYIADGLWALMLYFLAAIIFPKMPPLPLLALCFVGTWLVEFSQLYQADWINTVRRWPLMGLLLGYGFRYEDLIAYTIGIAVGFAVDIILLRQREKASFL
jgi:glycopeptide antibiotics resistance protein